MSTLLAVERDAALDLAEAHALRVFARREDQRVDRERRVGAEMQAVGRLVEGLAGELIERLVFLLGDLGLVLQPQRLDLVDALAVEEDREADEVAVVLDEVLDAGLLGVFGAAPPSGAARSSTPRAGRWLPRSHSRSCRRWSRRSSSPSARQLRVWTFTLSATMKAE